MMHWSLLVIIVISATNVTMVTPVHPMLPDERRAIMDKDGMAKLMCYAKPVKIGNDCWFGANVVVCPGVTIGDNCVIGAGSYAGNFG